MSHADLKAEQEEPTYVNCSLKHSACCKSLANVLVVKHLVDFATFPQQHTIFSQNSFEALLRFFADMAVDTVLKAYTV